MARVFGVELFAGTAAAAADAVVERAGAGAGGYACLCNVHVLVSSQHDPPLRGALDGAWTVFPDGWPVAWLLRRTGAPGSERIAGADLMQVVLGRPGLRHFLLGSTEDVLERLAARFPAAAIAGAYAPPFGSHDELGGAAEVAAAARADVVWCGLGAPKQELWMRRHAAALAPALVLGVGAAFDFLAGAKRRAPLWMQAASLEWLHRLASEPRRLAGRYARTNGEFVVRAAVELSRRRAA
jgi:N-acetylglucosaminyldiphosphoundecaprenol N-acetyl-beta-D-mannosaminyltransferase